MIIPWTCVSCWKRSPGLRFCVDPRLEVAQRAVPGYDDDADMIMMICDFFVGDDDDAELLIMIVIICDSLDVAFI